MRIVIAIIFIIFIITAIVIVIVIITMVLVLQMGEIVIIDIEMPLSSLLPSSS